MRSPSEVSKYITRSKTFDYTKLYFYNTNDTCLLLNKVKKKTTTKDGIFIVCGHNNQNKKKFSVINSPSKILSYLAFVFHDQIQTFNTEHPIHSAFSIKDAISFACFMEAFRDSKHIFLLLISDWVSRQIKYKYCRFFL